MLKKESPEAERRQYIRLDSVFPVEFRILSADGKQFLSDWLQGFTNNISKGGLCLAVNNLNPELAKFIKAKQVKLSLNIEMPLGLPSPVSAAACVAWVKDITSQPDKYLIGLSYEEILASANNRIMRYALAKKMFVPAVLTIILILGLGFAMGSYINVRLIKGNKALVEQLVKILQESSVAKQTVKQINKEREELQLKMQVLQLRIQTAEEEKVELEKRLAEEKAKLKESETAKRIEASRVTIEKLIQEKTALQEELITIQHKENTLTEELLRLDKKKLTLEKANLDKMYQWLKIHQNPGTGLVMSFEADSEIANWAFTYDQSLVAQVYTNFSDFERARKILDFFANKAKRRDGLFLNAYYFNDGAPAEDVVQSGPNIWLGIAMLQYTRKSKDFNYLKVTEEIASDLIELQNQDKEGGIRSGPNLDWYTREHNLDAYAFFNMLYKISHKEKYLQARDKVLNWLNKHADDKVDISVKRGRGDSTIATATYAWSIAAIGPQKLEALGMNPDMIVESAEKNSSVEVSYQRPEGQTIKIKGFDFAPQEHLARGGVVSSEWTAQMILVFKVMADFYYKKAMPAKARSYALKADEYLLQLGNMIVSSPLPSGQGESCLPYATEDVVDTGHGWQTLKGKSTGSLAGTAYTLFAYYNYNPLGLKE